MVWDLFEFEGADTAFPVDVANTSAGTADTNPAGTSIARSTTYDGKAVAIWKSQATGSTVPTFSAQTNGFIEQTDHGTTDGSNAVGVSVAWQDVQTLAAWESTATVSGGTVTSQVIVLTAEGAKREANIGHFWTFPDELSGYPACHSVSPSGLRYWETQTGSPTIDSDGLRLSGTSSIQQIGGNAVSVLSGTNNPKAGLRRLRFRINSVTGNLEVARSTAGVGGGHVVLRYVAALSKLGLQVGTGTEQLSDATVTTGVWYDVQWRLNGTTTAHTCDWRVNYGSGWVDQTQATFTASGALSTSWTPLLGWSAASTGNLSVAYDTGSVYFAHYPLGDYVGVFLGPDTAATPTVTGTTADYRRFTANGTIDGAYNGADIMAAIDDWPPTFGASADGLAIVTASANTLILIPMATYNAASNGQRVVAVRAVVPLWAASGTASTFALSGDATNSDGTLVEILANDIDYNADASSTPPWLAKLWRPANGWDQAKLDKAMLIPDSGDPNPDTGPHAMGLEVLLTVAEVMPLFGTMATQTLDPASGAVIAVTVNTSVEPGKTADLVYEEVGSPTTVPVAANTSHTEIIDAPDMPTINRIELHPE
jgi:hypothetical protein